MPRRLMPGDPFEVAAALGRWQRGEADRSELRLLVKHHLALLQAVAPGNSVEVRVPPFAAVQVVEGVRHTRGTPPAVVETDAETFLRLATGVAQWGDPTLPITASGERTDLSPYLPLTVEGAG